jgi:polar amino acid transport system substrate-binding protein
MTKILVVTLLVGMWAHLVFAKNKVLNFVSVEAPPFMGAGMKDQGAATHALSAIFKKMGYDLHVTFAPWLRAKQIAATDPNVVGFFPCAKDDLTDKFTLSKTLYGIDWSIAERKEKPVKWTNANDLAKYTGSNVNGYSIRGDIRKLVDEKKMTIETASDDVLNILKLANRRVDFIFTDALVFKFLLSTDPRLIPFKDQLQINAKKVSEVQYGIAFKKSPETVALIEQFNKAASPDELKQDIGIYLKELGEHNP